LFFVSSHSTRPDCGSISDASQPFWCHTSYLLVTFLVSCGFQRQSSALFLCCFGCPGPHGYSKSKFSRTGVSVTCLIPFWTSRVICPPGGDAQHFFVAAFVQYWSLRLRCIKVRVYKPSYIFLGGSWGDFSRPVPGHVQFFQLSPGTKFKT